MNRIPHRLRYALSACAVAGIRLTADRRRFLEVLASRPTPFVVEELVQSTSSTTGAHGVTCYRFLTALEEHGIVHRITVGQRRAVLLSCESIDYLVCRSCGVLVPVPEPPELKTWQRRLAETTGFLLGHHWHELEGVCPDCQHSTL
jgi:Fur family zinc uptake transcriptional regulator